ncbi:MAG: molecular chaperone HtpG [Planctomycetes bacterium]|nr:molecular chaperone HtpG [Planctomycetota bacterium]
MSETREFKAELKQLLHLIIHSLYSHKDIFLRELLSNASDAIDTVRFQSLTKPELVEGDSEWKIKLIPDEQAGTLTISDNGIGMSKETIVENLGTIAKSGTRAFLESLRQAQAENRPELIGQFGVGFYASFMVADKVTVLSRMAGKPEDGVRWQSDGQGEFTVEPCAKEKRGTDVILHLKPEDKEFVNPWRLRELVKKYSDFVEHPIVMDVEKEDPNKKKFIEEDTLNARKAIWLRPKSEVKQEEYDEFYKHLSHDFDKPLKTVHYSAEGQIEFKALLYIPAHRPFDLMWGDKARGLHLYIQRVFIMADEDLLLPHYLRFIRGVVDSPDLPLNVSREILQHSAPLEKIRSNLTNKVLGTLEEMKNREYDIYIKLFEEVGVYLKQGAYQDHTNQGRLADLLLFESTKTDPGKFTTLAQYLLAMPAEQTDIYYLAGESREVMQQSPHLESFKALGWEVLLLDEPGDEIVLDALGKYKDKRIRAINKEEKSKSEFPDDVQKKFAPLLGLFKQTIEQIKEARLTKKLRESAVCLVASEEGFSAYTEHLMRQLQREKAGKATKRILEVNPEHPVIEALQRLQALKPGDQRIEKYCRLLYDQALVTEGAKVQDPLEFAKRMNELMLKDVGG